MERYTVQLAHRGVTLSSFLVPFFRTAAISKLGDEVVKRASAHPTIHDSFHIVSFQLGDSQGPYLDHSDPLCQCIKADTEVVFVAIEYDNIASSLVPTVEEPEAQTLRIRVITPALAQQEYNSIPILPHQLTDGSKLSEIQDQVAAYLGLPVDNRVDTPPEENECNCSRVRALRMKASEKLTKHDGNTRLFFAISGAGEFQQFMAPDGEIRSIRQTLQSHFGEVMNDKHVTLFPGSENRIPAVIPWAAVCSKARHFDSSIKDDKVHERMYGDILLDLSIAEAPIVAHSRTLNHTVSELGLFDIAVDGVLDVYAVQRRKDTKNAGSGFGKDGIFLRQTCWELAEEQSDRGMAMFLSSLRVFTELINARNMEPTTQDAVLHLFHLLTRFLPAVRTVRILMGGKQPTLSERTALVQAIFEVTKKLGHLSLIREKTSRLLEGSRLLFGFLLEKAKLMQPDEDTILPYLKAFKTVDLKDCMTDDNILDPVATSFGLAERATVVAYQAIIDAGGIGESEFLELLVDSETMRLASFSAGQRPEITVLDVNVLNSNLKHLKYHNLEQIITSRELADLQHLANVCSKGRLTVIRPADLPSSNTNVLTLDRAGLLSVYVGRVACAADTGKDFSIFRPTESGEEAVDISIITQLLVPILERSDADGTYLFDSFGGGMKRNTGTPDEIIMLCVDSSASMSDRAGFPEFQDENYSITNASSNDWNLPDAYLDGTLEQQTKAPSFEEIREMLAKHDGFLDLVGMVQDASDHLKGSVSTKAIQIVHMYTLQELLYREEKLLGFGDNLNWIPSREKNAGKTATRLEAQRLKSFAAGLSSHKEVLTDYLVYCAINSVPTHTPWNWSIGDEIPKEVEYTPKSSISQQFSVPPDFRSLISHEIMEGPVIAKDDCTYDRNSIEKWLQISQRSPCTNSKLEDTTLRANAPVKKIISDWVKRVKGSENWLIVQFFSTAGTFQRSVPPKITGEELYDLAYRGLKGAYKNFQLWAGDTCIEPVNTRVDPATFNGGIRIFLHANDSSKRTSLVKGLVKVYDVYGEFGFAYWKPRNSTLSIFSIIAKYWRWNLKNNPNAVLHNRQAWLNVSYMGDRHIKGTPKEHWELVSDYMNSSWAKGILGDEPLYDRNLEESKPESQASDKQTTPSDATDMLVLKVHMDQRLSGRRQSSKIARLDVVKQLFDAFVNRILAYNFRTHMGLVRFATSALVDQKVTHALEDFRFRLNTIHAHGDTALWDAIALAQDQIQAYASSYPDAKKRIICLSDGVDTKSSRSNGDLVKLLIRNNIVLDSVSIGDTDNLDLRQFSWLTGGYKFAPKALETAVGICEMEPFLSVLERPEIGRPYPLDSPRVRFPRAYRSLVPNPDTLSRDNYPKRRIHPNMNDQFVELVDFARANQRPSDRTDSNLRVSRVMSEIRNVLANPHPHYDVYVSETNMAFWKIVMQGPPESAYETGTFVLYIEMEENFPSFPPKGRFVTPIYHPNINLHGRICHSIFDRNWTSDTTLTQVLNTVYSLLLVPEFSDPVNAVVTLEFHWDEVQFGTEVKEHISKHATKTRETLRREILGSLTLPEASDAGEDIVVSMHESEMGEDWNEDDDGDTAVDDRTE